MSVDENTKANFKFSKEGKQKLLSLGKLLPSGSNLAKCVVWEAFHHYFDSDGEETIYPRKLYKKYGGTRQAWEGQFRKMKGKFLLRMKKPREKERYKGGEWKLHPNIKEDLKKAHEDWREVYKSLLIKIMGIENIFCFAYRVLHLISKKKRTVEDIVEKLKQENIFEDTFFTKRVIEWVIRIFSPFIETETNRGNFYFSVKQERPLPILMSNEWVYERTENEESVSRPFWVELYRLSDIGNELSPSTVGLPFSKQPLPREEKIKMKTKGEIPRAKVGNLVIPKTKVNFPYVQFWWTGESLRVPPECNACRNKECKAFRIKGEVNGKRINHKQKTNRFRACSQKVRLVIKRLRLEKHSKDIFVLHNCPEHKTSTIINENLTRFIPTSFPKLI